MVFNKPSTTKVNILGTEYTVIVEKYDSNDNFDGCDGYFDGSVKEVHLAITTPLDHEIKDINCYRKQVLRHELIHAFMFESGLDVSSNDTESWAKNEEMIDWWAIQFHKIEKVFKELKI